MSTLTKSPIRVAREALAVATKALRPYAPKYSPQLYTQPQLFVCLVLKVYFKTDYRGVIPYLREWSELRRTIGLRCVPHFTTLHKASNRLLRVRRFRRLLRATLRSVRRAAFDSTGLDCGYRSASYVRRRSATSKEWQRTTSRRYAKLELAVDTANHVVLAVLTSSGPHPDTDRYVPLLKATQQHVKVKATVADGGYDSEPNHQYAREQCGVRSFMPATIGRPSPQPPTGYYRRQRRQRRNSRYGGYGQRWQVECTNSMIKRRLTSSLAARRFWAQCRELLLLVLTYQCMLVLSEPAQHGPGAWAARLLAVRPPCPPAHPTATWSFSKTQKNQRFLPLPRLGVRVAIPGRPPFFLEFRRFSTEQDAARFEKRSNQTLQRTAS